MNMKRIRNKVILSFFCGLLVCSLSGCFALVAGGVAETALLLGDRSPVSVVTIDRGLQIQIDSMLLQNFPENAHVNVNVYNQKVLLTGEVTTQKLKDQVQSNVAAIKNIRTVVNEIQVGPLSSMSARLSDSSLFTLVKAKLIATTDVPSNSMKIIVEAGSVYLMGITTELEAKASATVTSKSSNSIQQVVKLFDIITEDEKQKLINGAANEKAPTVR